MFDATDLNLMDAIEVHAHTQRRRPAVVCGDVSRSWGDLNANINRIAHGLIERGIGKGQQVAVLMGQRVETLEAILGAVKAGACAVPLSGLLTGEQLMTLVNDSDATAIFITEDYAEKLRPHLVAVENVEPDRIVSVDADIDGAISLNELTAGQPAERPDVVYAYDDPFNIIYTSGTTGLPKGILQTHRARAHLAISDAIELAVGSTSRTLTTTALSSNGTWTIMLPTLLAGGSIYVMPAFGPAEFVAAVEKYRITHTFMVPTQLGVLLDIEELTAEAMTSMQAILVGGSKLRGEIKRGFIERIGNKVTELYGCSEGVATMLKPEMYEAKPESVGRPVLGYECHIIDDDGRLLGPDQPGEIVGFGPGTLTEYYGRPDATEELIWRHPSGRTFVRTGDIGRLDDDGYLTIVDRKKDMIISGGYNVFPVDIEAIIAQHPAVQDVAVIGAPHEKWGETPMAVVIEAADGTFDSDEFIAWSNERLATHQRITRVAIVDDLPRNALGKVLKRDLRDQLL